jgi:hypothetical protein
VAQVEVQMIALHRHLAEAVVEVFAIRPAEKELVEVQLVAETVAAVVPKILQEVLSQRRLAVPSRDRLSKISSDMISIFL